MTDTIRMLDPVVPSEAEPRPAPARLATLDGARLALFNNGKLNAALVLDIAAEIIGERYALDGVDRYDDNVGFGRVQNGEIELHHPPDVALVAIGD